MKAREYLRFIICILGRGTTVMRGPPDNLKNPSPGSLNLAGRGASPWRSRSAALRGRYIVGSKRDVGDEARRQRARALRSRLDMIARECDGRHSPART